ncbi:DUF4937 domain-containing protein [Shewanella sp. OPT22]|nr:DUF4937 domain-containing protein [Shewanella sp. OPT22]
MAIESLKIFSPLAPRYDFVLSRTAVLAKLIKCQVPPRNRTEFSVGQQYWKQTNAADGFIFQLGGWTKDTAVILALWKDEASIESFMKTLHDPIADKAQQTNCYSSISVNYLKHIMDIPASPNSSKTHAKLIRVADCHVLEDRIDVFLEAQQGIWNSGMSSVPGMLGGYVWQCSKVATRFLVTTYWESELAHRRYSNNEFPLLKQKAHLDRHMQDVDGFIVITEPTWDVF